MRRFDDVGKIRYAWAMKKQRLDHLLVERGLADDIAMAQRLLGAGEVLVEGRLTDCAAMFFPVDVAIALKSKSRFVSRGGEKLAAAIERFAIMVTGKVAADIGASTGGFTDCLLHYGAAKVYAIDVGYGQLAWELRQDARVVVLERVNARYLPALPEPVDLIVSDVSFISLRLIYATAVRWLKPGGTVIALIKPQFEAERKSVGKGGVVRDPAVHRRVLETVTAAMAALGLGLRGLMVSPLRGPAGNVEFLGWWDLGATPEDIQSWIERTLQNVASM